MDVLPSSHSKNAILVVVDSFSKYGHFILISRLYTIAQVAKIFVREIFKLHGMSRTIVSDSDSTFMSQFWQAFFKLSGTQLCLSP